MSGDQQVGELNLHASIWTGTPESRVDLHVPGYMYSRAAATDGQEQAGWVATAAVTPFATVWRGNAQSAVSLHPSGAFGSVLTALAEGQEGGYFLPAGVNHPSRAALWSGTAQSMVNLHPGPTFIESQILGMAPGQQVGWAYSNTQDTHAFMWHGTAASWIDMDPLGSGLSEMRATCGSTQVGYAFGGLPGGGAGIWFGTRESYLSLVPFLPTGYVESIATSVAFADGLYYVGGYATNIITNRHEAFMWVGVPGPGTGVVMLAGLGLAGRRRRR